MSFDYKLVNKCNSQVWYRFYKEENFVGECLAANQSTTVTLDTQMKSLKGLLWETGQSDEWLPTFSMNYQDESNYSTINITPLFGPRPAHTIKVYMACLAGPADPAARNDITLIDEFVKAGVPNENIWRLLERQCTPTSIGPTLHDAASENVCQEGDILVVYLGGHGSGGSGSAYSLATWQGHTYSSTILDAIADTKAEVFMIVDSCHSGAMIDDAKAYFQSRSYTPKITILASTQSWSPARTGWRILQMLVDHVSSGKFITPLQVSEYVVENLRTTLETQRAQLATLPEN